jgi:hypothetical protein
VFVNMVLRRIFYAKRREVTGGWKRFCSEKIGFIRMTRSRKMIWTVLITPMRDMINQYKI